MGQNTKLGKFQNYTLWVQFKKFNALDCLND